MITTVLPFISARILVSCYAVAALQLDRLDDRGVIVLTRAERSPRAAHEHAARDQPLRRTRSGSTKTGSTLQLRRRRREQRETKSSASIEQLRLASGVNRFTIAKAQRFYICRVLRSKAP